MSLFSQFELSHFLGILTMKVNGQWVPCVRNSSYSFIPIHLKLYMYYGHGLKICMWFGYNPWIIFLSFLVHLSRRLIGELIVYPCSGVRPSSVVRPSSTISKIFFSETAGPIVLILHIHHLQVGGKNNCVFCFDRIRTLVAMATYASHRLIMEKSENCQFLLSCWRYLNFVFAEMFIE